MNPDAFKTPLSKPRCDPSRILPTTASKRDSLAAELERDPQLSTAKRQQRAQVFNSTLSHASLERQLSAAQTANAELEIKLRERELQIERLERDRRWLSDREKEEREEKERERESYEEAKRKAESEIRTLRTSLTTLREEHADLKDTHSSLSLSTSHSSSSQKAQITTLQHRIAILTDELSQQHQIAGDRARTLAQLQAEYDDLSTVHLELLSAAHEKEDMAVVREELQRQAAYLRSVESTNAKLTSELHALRERHVSVEVLKEEKRGLESKLARFSELREKVVRLEGELDAARRERESWAASSSSSSPSNPSTSNSLNTPHSSSSPSELAHTLTTLRLAHARLLEEHGSTSAQLRQRETELSNLNSQLTSDTALIASLEAQVRRLTEDLRRKDSRVVLAEREVGYLNALLASYKAEEDMVMGTDMLEKEEEVEEGMEGRRRRLSVDETKLERLEELEALLVQYKTHNDTLTRELSSLQSPQSPSPTTSPTTPAPELTSLQTENATLHTTLTSRDAQISEMTSQIADLTAQIDKLEQTLFELSGEVAGGRHVPPGVRVLCMRDNPEREWVDLRQATMDRVRRENEALLGRLKALEESGAGSKVGLCSCSEADSKPPAGDENANDKERENLVPRESYDHLLLTQRELETELKQKEKRLLRLQQVFTSKSAEFREAIACILGVKLAFYPNGQVRVTSMYDLGASFVFQPLKSTCTSSPGKGAGSEGGKGGGSGGGGNGNGEGGAGMKMQLVGTGEGGPQDLPSLMGYWIERENCPPGFMASVTLECYEGWKRRQELEEQAAAGVGGAS